MDKTTEIILEIENAERISFEQSFKIVSYCTQLLSQHSAEAELSARKIVIHVLNNWGKIDKNLYVVWADLIETLGFYPYIQKNSSDLKIMSFADDVRMSYFKSDLYLEQFELTKGLNEANKCHKILDIGKRIIEHQQNSICATGTYVNMALAKRVLAVHLRTFDSFAKSEILTFEEIKLNIDTHIAQIKDVEIKLTRTEYAILKLLMQNQTQVVSKSHLLDHISEDTPDCTESSLKTHISNLRKKLRAVNGKEYIEAVWGIGFKMKEE